MVVEFSMPRKYFFQVFGSRICKTTIFFADIALVYITIIHNSRHQGSSFDVAEAEFTVNVSTVRDCTIS